jgi:hypothetical protein
MSWNRCGRQLLWPILGIITCLGGPQ